MSSSAVRLVWKCHVPRDLALKTLCEELVTSAARQLGADTGVIRKEPHDTTGVYNPITKQKEYVKTQMHITAAVVNSVAQTGHSLHYYVDEDKKAALPSTSSNPNPEHWGLKHVKNKGFVLVDGDESDVITID